MHLIAILNREIRIYLRKERAELMLCFAIAAVFWFMVKLSQSYETQWNFDFEYILPANQAFVSKPPSRVETLIGGTGWNLMYFSLFQHREPLVYDLNNLPLSVVEGRLVIDRIQSQLSGSKLEVKGINLDYIGLKTETKSARRLPIKLNYLISLQPQFDFSVPVRLKPDSVWVQGSASQLDSLQFWPTDTGRIGPLKAGKKVMVPLALDPSSAMELDVSKTELSIQVEAVVEKTIFFVPVTVVNAPKRLRIFPPTVTIYCMVGMSGYHQLGASDFTVVADLEEVALHSEQNTVPLNITCHPEHVKNVRFSPQSVEFFFKMDED